VSFVDSLYPLVTTGDAGAAHDLLAGLNGAQLSEAKSWFAKATRWYATIPQTAFRHGEDSTANHECWVESHRVMALCAVELSGPTTAATRVPWDAFWEHQQTQGDDLFVDAVCDKDPSWVAHFVEAASHRSGRTLSRTLRAINARVPVPCPSGPGYVPPWTGYFAADALAEEVAADPWMPETLFHVLDNGDCATWPNLPSAVRTVVDLGQLDRIRVVAHVVGLLTSPQRPASQRVLVGILAAVDLRDDELPGIDYVLSVMATSTGAVGKFLLPIAIRMVSAEDLSQLVGVIAARQEKAQKETLLAVLKGELLDRLGTNSVVEALTVLAGDEDSAFSAKVVKVLAAIGGQQLPSTEQPAPLGLWDLEPTPSPEGVRPVWPSWDFRTVAWSCALDRHAWMPHDIPAMIEVLVSDELVRLAEGRGDDFEELRRSFARLVADGNLQLGRFTTMLPELFMAGGMRAAWPAALDLADLCARQPKIQTGLADLLRTLTRFAPEAPPGELPFGIAALAARPGSSKAQMEARALGVAMSEEGRVA
jgi:hypothetical protein